MDHKIQKSTEKKISVNTDSQDTVSDHLLIPNRSIVDQNKVADDIPTEINTQSEVASPLQSAIKHNIVTPPSHPDDLEQKNSTAAKSMDTKSPIKKAVTPLQSNNEITEDTPQANKVGMDAPVATSISMVTDIQKEPESPSASTTKRDQEIEDIIDSHQYFVPIDTIGRRRSINVSIILTVLIFLLGVVLIDVMLDSGTILLLQKIPHTHFFSLNNN